MKQANRMFQLATLLLLLAGCASTPELSRQEVMQQYDTVAGFASRLTRAAQQGVDYLAPNGYASAQASYDEAFQKAAKSRGAEAEALVEQGLKRLDKAETDAAQSRIVMREVLATRERALAAGADKLQPQQFGELDDDLRSATRDVERGDLEDAKKKRADLMGGYSELELQSLKKDATQAAKADIQKAREKQAHKYAPKTFKQAEEELQLAVSVLEANRADRDKARVHALRAGWLAERSMEIVELVKEFDQRDFSAEDIVLWYQDQLSLINKPKGDELPFDKPNYEVVGQLQGRMATLIDVEAQLLQLQETEKEVRKDLEYRMQAAERANREAQARYDQIQAMFSEAEANVYRQGHNVLLETHAFYFPVGVSEVQSDNFDLLHKIVKAIKVFPSPQVVVRGHTDATGSDQNNLKLSQQRAEKVAAFLSKLGDIQAKSIKAMGYGESRPVASNETEAGRALNRRIEVLIVNE
jgi:outer membrane protein OmpA-like peptidoglycan-associated protein